MYVCILGLSIAVEPQSISVHPPPNIHHVKNGRAEFEGVRRFACPVGFFRLKRNCYYLSAGVAPWRDAYFHCRDRNATLAVLDKHPKDRILRKYLMGDQFSKFFNMLITKKKKNIRGRLKNNRLRNAIKIKKS